MVQEEDYKKAEISILKTIKSLITNLCWKIIKVLNGKITTNYSAIPDLSATNNAKFAEHYIDRLNEYLINRSDRVREIALTAPYSAGKTSILKTFQKRFPNYKCTIVSLGSFTENEKEIKQNDDNDQPGSDYRVLNKIEKSIVQQLLYRVKSEKYIASRFRRIIPKPQKRTLSIIKSIIIILWFLLLGYLIVSDNSTVLNFINQSNFNIFTLKISAFINTGLLSFLISLAVLLLKDLLQYIKEYSVKGINPLKGEIALEQKNNDSVFNIYLEEIIYYFTVSGSEVVIFEDLDRFNEPQIFVQLKELNKLINDSADVKQNVRFIYAVKDDVFDSNDRTKFFDAIIPIIPISNNSNSYSHVKELLKSSGVKDDIDDELLRDVSVFINDMRILKNIVSEYLLYKEVLSENIKSLYSLDSLFGYIVYKNCFASDFAKLHANDGVLYTVLKKIKSYKSELRATLQQRKNEITEEINKCRKEKLNDVEELNSLVIFKFINSAGINQPIEKINNQSLNEIIAEEKFNALLNIRVRVPYTYHRHGRHQNATFVGDIPKFIEENGINYYPRLKVIKNASEAKIKNLNRNLIDINSEIKAIRSMSPKQVCLKMDRTDLVNDIEAELSNHNSNVDIELLLLLIRKGYIDEHYHNFTSHFKEGRMNSDDMMFVSSIKTKNAIDPNHVIYNHSEVLKYINSDNLSEPSLINYSLIEYLLMTSSHEEILSSIVKSLLKHEDFVEVLSDSFDVVKNYKDWLAAVIKDSDSLWDKIIGYDKDQNIKDALIAMLLSYSDKNALGISYGDDGVEVKEHLEENESFINLSTNIEVLAENLSELGVQFNSLGGVESNEYTFDTIFKNRLFKLNKKNLMAICNSLFDMNIDSLVYEALSIHEELKEYLEQQINQVCRLVVEGDILIESSLTIIELLQNENIDTEQKEKLIKDIDFKLETIGKAPEEHYSLIVMNNRIEPSWSNINEVYNSEEVEDSAIGQYLSQEIVYTKLKDPDELEEQNIDKLVSYALHEAHATAFTAYAPLIKEKINEIQFSTISEDKLELLLKDNHIKITKSHYKELYDIDSRLALYLVLNDINKGISFITGEDKEPISEDAIVEILSNDKVPLPIKYKLITDVVNIDELGIELVDTLEPLLKGESAPRLTTSFFERLFKNLKTAQAKLDVLNAHFDNLESEVIKRCLKVLGDKYAEIITFKRDLYLDNTSSNLTLATNLEKRGLISSCYNIKDSKDRDSKQLKLNAKRKHK